MIYFPRQKLSEKPLFFNWEAPVDPALIGKISLVLAIVATLPYMFRVYQREITPPFVSWVVWSAIGVALLFTFKSSGAKDNMWPAVVGCVAPIIITCLVYWKSNRTLPEDHWERIITLGCAVLAALSLVAWVFVHDDKILVTWALILAIVADACALVPTFIAYVRRPQEDRPFAWMCFGVAYGISAFAAKENTVVNWVLPLYMLFGACAISAPLVIYRVRNKIPISEWI